MRENPLMVSKGEEHIAKLAPEIDVAFDGFSGFRETPERDQRLFEARRRLTVSRTRGRLGTGLAEIRHGLSPKLTPEGVVGQPFHMLDQAVGKESLNRLDDPRVEGPAPLLEQAPVGHLVGEGVLEGVLEVGKEARLVEELARLEMAETPAKLLLRKLGDHLEEGKRYILAHDRGSLEQPLVLGRQAIDPGRKDRLDRGRHLDRGKRGSQREGASLPAEDSRLRQGPNALLQEEGIPPGAIDQKPLQGLEARVAP